ncbi:hypothetical protein BOO93_06570, partial [Vibrio navarrensis]|nr:hypothetical protein [Vibrio navarrensis]
SFFKKSVNPLINTGSAHHKKLGDLGARVSLFEMSEGQQSHFHPNRFLLACELFKVDIIETVHSE